MNCKSGDIAIVVRCHHKSMRELIGRVVRVSTLAEPTSYGLPAWNIEEPPCIVLLGNGRIPDGSRFYIGESVLLPVLPDAWLMPVRPGPDAIDETLRELEAA